MKILLQLSFLLSLWLIGELISQTWHLPIPGNVLGMVFLFFLLSFKLIKTEQLKEISDFLLGNLAFFFVPYGVGLLSVTGVLRGNWWQILLIVFVTTVLVIGVTGLTAQFLARERGK
ncbi:MAG TPA: CidA/LrgA family protein [Syntrophomonadaceae bacterium]|nr:CidA/LrgA family protein [Syntrophomonadaceae bacterium]